MLNIVQPTLLTNSGATLPFQQMIPISDLGKHWGNAYLPSSSRTGTCTDQNMSGPQNQPATFSSHLPSPIGKALPLVQHCYQLHCRTAWKSQLWSPTTHAQCCRNPKQRWSLSQRAYTPTTARQQESGWQSRVSRAAACPASMSAEHFQQWSALSQVLLASPHLDS